MRVFLTGATGFIGSRIVPELLAAGHQVLGLTRSEAGARSLIAAGAEPHRGDLEDLDSLRDGAAKSDAVIHTAFDHNFSNFVANCEKDKRVIEALGGALAGSDRLLIITSGVGMGSAEHGQPAREDVFNTDHPNPRILSEFTGAAIAEKGVKVSVVRLPQVHDTVKQGLITPLIAQTRAKGVSAYLGEGRNRWSAAHVLDVAKLYRLALDKQEAGVRYNAVAEEGIPVREIAEVIGVGLNVPVVSLSQDEAADHFGWLAMFAGLDLPASSEWTRAHLSWQPTGPGLIADLKQMDYSQAAAA
ncbi:MAG: SDR family oxidoreductase [Mesorhizobium sp.]|uniref:SDR family oxidoreductase n=2 Tax=Mesorhizobium TaxID=68287 RepID=UPI000FCA4F5E|nr:MULTISPECIES: SDR family oxidoreductase [unclassified Mesorhizobium]RUW43161.1 SDR family oxidoreductase [Mesorhizobium sp. M2A.F.Ca.ET.015.02.1.1]RVC92939.1 SDR family oxidoreductase [Mesorhizobium sp. M2A.F.Ca.ET.017.03.2.1]RVD11547.1 SDR family oxidoreductase [Mesorhizobium sp. M2A.F.Ca.ET.029.05.1.1]RWB48893.1 MAG: SDR family oxidoreductase [Mesorhizobium sp.]RWB64197.1 MAG: SDR family oxidoreductase [Mesorhizobium sp.]